MAAFSAPQNSAQRMLLSLRMKAVYSPAWLSRFLALFVAAVATLFAGAQADASYMVVPFSKGAMDRAVRTHILVTSKGNDLGFGPQLSALTKAAKIADVYPTDQVVLILTEENGYNLRSLKLAGFTTAYQVNKLMDGDTLFDELVQFPQIASMHFFGHGAIPEGVFLDAKGKWDIRWYPRLKHPTRIVGHFTSDAFVTLNQCNLGHSMAPMLSRLWQVPVAGALTGTHFEVLMPEGKFSVLDQGSEKRWAKSTLGTLRTEGTCLRGCFRMRPDNGIYNGHYGKYTQGLPFYKFFCAGISEEACLKGMARSLVTSVTAVAVPAQPTFDQYAQAAREWLCPTGPTGKFQKNCDEQLKNIPAALAESQNARFYTPFRSANHQCSFEGCYEKKSCLVISKFMSETLACAQNEKPTARATTFVDEYANYLRGFELLMKETKLN